MNHDTFDRTSVSALAVIDMKSQKTMVTQNRLCFIHVMKAALASLHWVLVLLLKDSVNTSQAFFVNIYYEVGINILI